MKISARIAALVVALLVASAGLASAAGLTTIATINGRGSNLQFSTYTTDNGQKATVLSLAAPGADRPRVVFALDASDLRKLRTALVDAHDMTAAGHKVAGILSETGTTHQCVIVVHGGSSMELTIIDPESIDAVTFPIAPGDYAAVLSATDRLLAFLGS